jgi:hypothetical protein
VAEREAPEAEAAEAGPPPDVRRWLPWMGLGVAVWAALPWAFGPQVNVADESVEIVNHVLPSIVVALASVVALLARPRPGRVTATRFFCGLVVLLAGLFVMATHIPLLLQAARGEHGTDWVTAIWHNSAAFAVFGLGLLWTVTHWSDLAEMEAQGKPS